MSLRVKRYKFGAHRKPLNVRFAPKATQLLLAANCREGREADINGSSEMNTSFDAVAVYDASAGDQSGTNPVPGR